MERNLSKAQLEHIKKVNQRNATNNKSLAELKKGQRKKDDLQADKMADAFNDLRISIGDQKIFKHGK